MITIKGKKARICIDPGHGGADPGAVGLHGLKEDETVLKVAKELMYQLDLLGVDSLLTRTEDAALSLSARVEKSKDCAAFISIHCNAADARQASGIETVFGAQAGQHKALANYVQQSMMKYFPKHKDRGLKMSPSMGYPRSLFVLHNAIVPACLVECEFISNEEMEKWLGSEEAIGQIAHALSEGIKSFLMSLPGAVSMEEPKNAVLASTPVVEPEVAAAEPILESPKVQDKLPMFGKKKSNKKT